MLIIPAIDILDGKCVRLQQGDYAKITEYNNDPLAVAKNWVQEGAKYLHLVDLNGAKEGKPVNLELACKIAANLSIPVELGGGIRNLETIKKAFNGGIDRIVLGTIAYAEPDFIRECSLLYPGKIAVGIDGRNGQVAVEGWVKKTSISVLELAQQLTHCGVAVFIYTDISRDGTLTGPNLTEIKRFSQSISKPFIASGGISSLEDIKNLVQLNCPNLTGVIIGKAFYDGRISLTDALKIL